MPPHVGPTTDVILHRISIVSEKKKDAKSGKHGKSEKNKDAPICNPEVDEAVSKDIKRAGVATATVAVQPVPFVELLFITPIQIGMVRHIGVLRGYHFDKKAALEIWKSFRASVLTQTGVITAVKFVPGIGSIAAATVAYSLTTTIGEVFDYYFRHDRKTPMSELLRLFKALILKKKDQEPPEEVREAAKRRE